MEMTGGAPWGQLAAMNQEREAAREKRAEAQHEAQVAALHAAARRDAAITEAATQIARFFKARAQKLEKRH